jgi:hypothetical protein
VDSHFIQVEIEGQMLSKLCGTSRTFVPIDPHSANFASSQLKHVQCLPNLTLYEFYDKTCGGLSSLVGWLSNPNPGHEKDGYHKQEQRLDNQNGCVTWFDVPELGQAGLHPKRRDCNDKTPARQVCNNIYNLLGK